MHLRLILLVTVSILLASSARAQTWSDITPVAGPPIRTRSAAIYDPVNHCMVIFGGQASAQPPTFLNDVWAFDLTTHTWNDITPSTGSTPPARQTPCMVYDAAAHRLVMWSGQDALNFYEDTWQFDLATQLWSQYNPNPMPLKRYGIPGVWDPVGGDLVCFAGFTFNGRFEDTWRFNAAAGTWTDVSPAGATPLKRCLHTASYNSADHAMLIFGGQGGNSNMLLGDVWSFDLTNDTWTELLPGNSGPAHMFPASIYEPFGDRLIIYGGSTFVAKSPDVWMFAMSNQTWTQLLPGGTIPPGRDGATAVYVPSEDRMVIFGGNDGQNSNSNRNDVWSLDDLSNDATAIATTLPGATQLFQNHPNPFNPTTTIAFELSLASHVELAIYSPHGARVRTLVSGFRAAGPQRALWDGTSDDGTHVASGVYFYRLTTPALTHTRKLVLLK